MASNIFKTNIDNLVSQATGALETYTSLMGEPTVSNEAKLIAAAVALAGAEIGTALFQTAAAKM